MCFLHSCLFSTCAVVCVLYRNMDKSLIRRNLPLLLEYLFDDDENDLLSSSLTGLNSLLHAPTVTGIN